MFEESYRNYMFHKNLCETARRNGEYCLSDWSKSMLLKKLEEAIESMELNREYKYLNPITEALKSRSIHTLEDFKKDINKRYNKAELQEGLLEYTGIYKTGNRLRHTRFYKFKDSEGVKKFICNYYKAPKPVQLKLNLE